MSSLSRIKTLPVSLAAVALFGSPAWSLAEPWSFGVMADTQWRSNLDGENPNTVAVGIIKQLNTQFIGAGVKFVVQVGDLVDTYSASAFDTRAAAAQALYDAGIGFYPVRGNHEGSRAAAVYFQTKFPQTQGNGPYVFGATNFSYPFENLKGLSYSFDFGNTRLVLIDQFTRTDNTGSTNSNMLDQVIWVGDTLFSKPRDSHAFVFAHKGLMTENHADILFGANPSSNPAAQNAFIASLINNGVRYFMNGHDHMHHRTLVTSPDGLSTVQDITTSSNSYKFYIPATPTTHDEKYNQNPTNNPSYCVTDPVNRPTCQLRETPIAQELFTVGYYIVTVDGPRVTVDHYASDNGCSGDCDLTVTPSLTFVKRETFGYSLNGKEFLVKQGQSYLTVQDSFTNTTAQILSGSNDSTATDYNGRPFTKTVNTGWTAKTGTLASDILSLWGLAGTLGSSETDVYTLAVSYQGSGLTEEQLRRGVFGLAAKDAKGKWINAVDQNFGGTKQFVYGPWNSSYGLGTYGIDPATQMAWAVINHESDFAVTRFAAADFLPSTLITRKSGPTNARVWTIKLFSGPNTANDAQLDRFTLTQSSGPACTPLTSPATSLPMALGDIGPNESATGYVQLDFTGCAPAARFTATIHYSANSGALHGSKTLYNQFR